MGALMWGAYGLQTIGLAQTTAGKSAFLTGTYCILVPFASYVLSGEKLTRSTISDKNHFQILIDLLPYRFQTVFNISGNVVYRYDYWNFHRQSYLPPTNMDKTFGVTRFMHLYIPIEMAIVRIGTRKYMARNSTSVIGRMIFRTAFWRKAMNNPWDA